MIPKPPGCTGCPAREWGDYWVPDTIVPSADIELVLQNPGEYEEQGLKVTKRIGKNKYETVQVTPQPLIGPTGYDCDTQWFPIAGLNRSDISITNTIRCRQQGTNELLPVSSKALHLIQQACLVHQVHTSPKLRIACGSYAAKAVGCPGTVTDWRGHLLPDTSPPTLIMLHPADLNHNPKMGVVMLKDWAKVPRILDGSYPKPLPKIQYFRGSKEDEEWFAKAVQTGICSVDTEYVLSPAGESPTLKLIGLTYPQAQITLSVWWSPEVAPSFTNLYMELVRSTPIVFWNGIADIPVLQHATGVKYEDYYRIEDPMVKHSLLWSELPHTLEFCASVDGAYPKLKHLMAVDLALYNQGDVLETQHLNSVYDKELDDDPQTRHVYETQSLPLIPIILVSQSRGIRVDREAVIQSLTEQRSLLAKASDLAKQSCGYEINLSSSGQVQKYLYEEKGYPIQKHYKTKRPTVDQGAINTLRSTHVPVDVEYEEQEGLDYAYIQQRIRDGGEPFLEAMALHSGSRNIVTTYLLGLTSRLYRASTDKERRAARTWLDSMEEISIDEIVSRVYPEYKQHTQANGRWSITNPPMAGMPKSLHHLFIPDEQHCWIKFDFKQIEPRIRACLSKDTPRLRDFEQGKDIYQSTCLEMFGRYTPSLRKLAKVVELALSYGKQPKNMHHVPGILGYGFKKEDLTNAANNYLRAHREQTLWMVSHINRIRTTGYSREEFGRKRNLLGYWADQEREGLNQPMQAGATSLTNLTIIKIAKACPDAYLVNNRFDEQWWGLPIEQLDTYRQNMIEILAQPWTINGIKMVFPVDPPNLQVIYAP